jgi:mannose-6-phosphate isomerase-like protein (cupin superfamily)
MESGTFGFDIGGEQNADAATPGTNTSTLRPGEQILIPANTPYSVRNEGGEQATLLRVVMYASAPIIEPMTGITYQLLVGGVTQSLPPAPTWVTVSRVSLAAGASVSTRGRTQDGPDLAFIEAGVVSVAVPGAELVLSPGGTAIVQPNTEVNVRDAGTRPAVILVVSFSNVPLETPVATPEAGTPVA